MTYYGYGQESGGTESYIRNLLDGFLKLQEDFDFTLLVSRDNAETFRKYEEDRRYHLLTADIESANIAKRIIWQNLFQNEICFVNMDLRSVLSLCTVSPG